MKKDLHIALDEIKRSDGHVSEATAEDPSGGTRGVESRRVHFDLSGLARSRNHEVLRRRRRTQDRVPIRREMIQIDELLRRRRDGVEEARDERLARAV